MEPSSHRDAHADATSTGDGALSPTPPTASGFSTLPGMPEVAASGFSALDLDDRVVIALLFNEVVREAQGEAAWVRWKARRAEGAPTQLWRVLAEDPDIDREEVFAMAAEAFAFKKTEVPKHSALGTLHATLLSMGSP